MASPTRPAADDGQPGSRRPRILDRLEMLVTGDPVAELDAALATASTHLRAARSTGDTATAGRLARWIDDRLDQRNALTPPP